MTRTGAGRTAVLLVVVSLPAGCGARSELRGTAADGGGSPAPANPDETPAVAPTALPCTGGYPRTTGSLDALRIGPCRWHSADPADLSNPDLRFLNFGTGEQIASPFVTGPEGCTANALGWYLLPTDSGTIGEAPVVMTFAACPAACQQIQSSGLNGVSFNLNTCK
ncbi:MAG TPA: hypothetical protein VHE30_07145 [Polyangiaceae bacterium]|nr:hypothetical protein [Polyangiaceae bacterium]